MSSRRFPWLISCALFGSHGLAAAQGSSAAERTPTTGVPERGEAPIGTSQAIDAETALRRALSGSASLQSARLGTAQAVQDVLVEEGRYPYVWQADAGYTRSASPRLRADDSVSTGTSRSYIVGTAIRRTFPFGTTAEVRLQGERFESETDITEFGSTGVGTGYGTTARASINHPLLRGSGTQVGELGLRSARQSHVFSQKAQRRAESELARDVLLAYWELWYADESVRIEQAALELARQQERQAQEQQAQGALAPADVYTFSTRVAGLEETMVSTLIQKRQRSLELTRLMGAAAHTAPELFASDTPVPGALPSTKQVEAALRSGSVELAELEAQVRLARIRVDVAGDSSRPRLDLEGFVESNGESELPLRSVQRSAQLNWITAHVGAVFELPLDGTRQRAEKQSALLGVRIAEQNLRATRERLAADAVFTVAEARAAEERLGLSERTVAVAQQAFEAARARFELGGAIAIQVQQAEEEVRRARLRLARTRVELIQAQVIVQHLSGALVPRRRIETTTGHNQDRERPNLSRGDDLASNPGDLP